LPAAANVGAEIALTVFSDRACMADQSGGRLAPLAADETDSGRDVSGTGWFALVGDGGQSAEHGDTV
jgi:hypothetical protein